MSFAAYFLLQINETSCIFWGSVIARAPILARIIADTTRRIIDTPGNSWHRCHARKLNCSKSSVGIAPPVLLGWYAFEIFKLTVNRAFLLKHSWKFSYWFNFVSPTVCWCDYTICGFHRWIIRYKSITFVSESIIKKNHFEAYEY